MLHISDNYLSYMAVLVGTFRLVGEHIVADAVNAALATGYRLIGEWKLTFAFYIMFAFITSEHLYTVCLWQ